MSQLNRNWSSYFYDSFSRTQWMRFGAGPYRLSAEALASLKGINEPMSVSDVAEVVGPLCGLLDQQLAANPAQPYVIAVSGSVAVGKSTFSRVLRALLAQSNRTVELIATGSCGRRRFWRSETSCTARGFLKATTLKAC